MRRFFMFLIVSVATVFVGCNKGSNNPSSTVIENDSSAAQPTSTNAAYVRAENYEEQYNEQAALLPVLSDVEKEKVFAIAVSALGDGAVATSAVVGPYGSSISVYQVSVHFQGKLYEVVIHKETFEVIDTIFRADL